MTWCSGRHTFTAAGGDVPLERVVHAGLPPLTGGAEELQYFLRDSKRLLHLPALLLGLPEIEAAFLQSPLALGVVESDSMCIYRSYVY